MAESINMTPQEQRQLALQEFAKHSSEFHRAEVICDRVMADMDYHKRQMETWTEFIESLGSIAVTPTREVMRGHLRLVQDSDAG